MRRKSARFRPLANTAGWLALLFAVPSMMSTGCGPAVETTDDAEQDASLDPDVVELSPEARNSIGIQVRPLKRTNYAKSIRIPGQVVEIPGVTRHDIATKTSGEIAKIHVLEGEEVEPGAILFEIELTHQEAIQHQLELLDALAKLEVVDAEISRLQKLLKSSEGAVPKTRLLTEQYERNHLRHTISSRRQILVLLGLDEAEVDQMIEDHKHHQQDTDDSDDHDHDPTLITHVNVSAPRVAARDGEEPVRFVLQDLAVRPGQHVDVGDLLCNVVDLRRLYIEGQAFQRDLGTVRHAQRQNWQVSAVFPQRSGQDLVRDELSIHYIASQVDHESRSARFFVSLPNPRMKLPDKGKGDDAPRRFLPGQRVELHVPVHAFHERLVLPVDAVARDGLHDYIFQASGRLLVRREVDVALRDEDHVVLADSAALYEDASVAMSGAYQLQLSLQNRSKGPAVHEHGGAPHSH